MLFYITGGWIEYVDNFFFFWLKKFRFLFLKTDAGGGTQGLHEYWASALPWSYSRAHEKLLQIG